MTPEQFVSKWKASTRSERAAAQEQFIDLCHMLDEQTPGDDPTGEWFAFEKGANKTTGTSGWADVWKAGHFAWENKGKGKDLKAAFAQLQQYAGALGNPPLLVVSDLQRFRIHTAWTNTVSKVYELTLDDLLDAKGRDILKAVLADPERLRPGLTRQALTEQAAENFAALARRLRDRGHDADRVAHFVNRLVFSMFAEDVELLPNKMFQRMLEACEHKPEQFGSMAETLFAAMRTGGLVGFEQVEWFNGGLFDDDQAIPLDKDDIKTVLAAARLDWAEIDPSIFGTLFERGLDPDKRSQLGAHYTDRDKIMLIVEPVVAYPLASEWEAVKAEMVALLDKATQARVASVKTKARNDAEARYRAFLDRLRSFRVLDPACGSGNFLYLALLTLKDLEHRAGVEAEAMGLQREFPQVGPEAVYGIEINPYAAELARISVWIGEIQWMKRNGFGVRRNPILRPLDNIENRDAILNDDGTEAVWPSTEVVIGNPPFLGGKWILSSFPEQYVAQLRTCFANRVPPTSDLVAYWFAKAADMIATTPLQRAGFVATNMIRGPANRQVMTKVGAQSVIYDAWSDEPWMVDGADVRVSLVCVRKHSEGPIRLNGETVEKIHPDLSSGQTNLAAAFRLPTNSRVAIRGVEKGGPFDVPGDIARSWLLMPLNPNGRPNADVLFPTVSGIDLMRRPMDLWTIDFGSRTEDEASLYEVVFEHAVRRIKAGRAGNREQRTSTRWWRHRRSGADVRNSIATRTRFLCTALVSKHRVFTWVRQGVLPDTRIVVIARDDDTTFGILSSRYHEAWTLRSCQYHGVGNDPVYTPSTTFETFPFPDGLTPDSPAADYADDPRAQAIAAAAQRLDGLRRNWLNPSDLVDVVPEVVPGFPDRLLPKDERAVAILARRTLTNLYNERPQWLINAHADLDAAVAAAYGWPPTITEDEALANLLALNLARAGGS